LAGAVPAAGFGSVASLKALGYKAFNEKLNIAGVGVGGRGADDLRGCSSENIVALCDVDSRQGRRCSIPTSGRCSTRKTRTSTPW
jgi:hypothetical protein